MRKKGLIVVVEDEADLRELLEYHLQKEGYAVASFGSTKGVEASLNGADLLLIDRNLPGEEGSEYVQRLRQNGCEIPVIFLSAKERDDEIEEGFLRGGDDYVTKPFNMRELLLRIRAILRRSGKEREILVHRDIILDPAKREVRVGGEAVELTKLEFDLLELFIKNRGVVLERHYLLEAIWRDEAGEGSVNVAIKRLKEKIDPERTKGYIEAIRGVGYKLV
jgi:DNA-binding response OmpR family regulator